MIWVRPKGIVSSMVWPCTEADIDYLPGFDENTFGLMEKSKRIRPSGR